MPAPTPEWSTITLTGTYKNLVGAAISGTVDFTLNLRAVDATGDVIVIPTVISATLDGSGHFSVALPVTDDPDITPSSGLAYAVKENFTGGSTYSILLPTSLLPTVDLSSLTPAVPGPPITMYATVSGVADAIAAHLAATQVNIPRILGLGPTASVPGGTPSGTLIARSTVYGA
jgi:hypothetical protein